MKLSYAVVNPTLVSQSSILAHPAHVRWAWLALIIEGQFRDGIIPGLTPFQLSRMAACSIAEAQEALTVFLSPDPYSACQEEEGRRLVPTGVPNEFRMVSYEGQQQLITKARDAARKRADRYSSSRTETDTSDAVRSVLPPSPTPSPTPSKEKTASASPRSFEDGSREMKAASFFFAEIRKDVPEMKEPNWQAWARDFDAMFRIDQYEPKQVKDVILFARADPFWSVNILSPKTLRKQFVKLLAKMRAQAPSSEPPKRLYQEQPRKTE